MGCKVGGVCIDEAKASKSCNQGRDEKESCPGQEGEPSVAERPFENLKSDWQKESSEGDTSEDTTNGDECQQSKVSSTCLPPAELANGAV